MKIHILASMTLAISVQAFVPSAVKKPSFLPMEMKREDFLKVAVASFVFQPFAANGQEIKVMDMSLPSYGSISDPKSDLESLKGNELGSVRREGSTKKSGGGNKTTTSSKQQKAVKTAVSAAEKAEEDRISKLKFVDTSMPSYK
jgi:hypothetical protein